MHLVPMSMAEVIDVVRKLNREEKVYWFPH